MSLVAESQDKFVILVHNLRNLKTLNQVEIAIQRDIFEVFNNTPLEQVFDLGKFLFKERMA